MNKSELIFKVAEKSGVYTKDVEKVITTMLDTIAETLVEERKISIMGFGTFEVKARGERVGRNPATGESIVIPKAKVPHFIPSKLLKESINKQD